MVTGALEIDVSLVLSTAILETAHGQNTLAQFFEASLSFLFERLPILVQVEFTDKLVFERLKADKADNNRAEGNEEPVKTSNVAE